MRFVDAGDALLLRGWAAWEAAVFCAATAAGKIHAINARHIASIQSDAPSLHHDSFVPLPQDHVPGGLSVISLLW